MTSRLFDSATLELILGHQTKAMSAPSSIRFPSHPRTHWADIPESQWNDYRWQLRNRVTSLAQLKRMLTLSDEERAGILFAAHSRLALSITPHFFSLIDPDDPNCPIRRQVIPHVGEALHDPFEMDDPCGEDADMPVPGLVHRYPDRVLLIVTDRCASYCRHCTRSRAVSGVGPEHIRLDWERALDYLRQTPSVRDVLISGGDPLILSDSKLDQMLGDLRQIEHIEFIRMGSRVPLFLPQRITPELCAVLRKHSPLFVSIHTNHPKELCAESRRALDMLADNGIPLGNQSVLLKGLNDTVETQKELVHKLLMCRVKPYYLYQCDLIRGSNHFRTSIQTGIDIINGMRGFTSGYAIPQYVIDGPGGGGKIPVNPEYVVDRKDDVTTLRNYEGELFVYPEPVRHSESEISRKTASLLHELSL